MHNHQYLMSFFFFFQGEGRAQIPTKMRAFNARLFFQVVFTVNRENWVINFGLIGVNIVEEHPQGKMAARHLQLGRRRR